MQIITFSENSMWSDAHFLLLTENDAKKVYFSLFISNYPSYNLASMCLFLQQQGQMDNESGKKLSETQKAALEAKYTKKQSFFLAF